MWTIIGIIALMSAVLVTFWNEIANWLNHTAADVVGKYLGYNARKGMQKAICVASRAVNKVRTIGDIFVKKHPLDTRIDKVRIEATAPEYEVDQKVLQKMEKERQLTQDFQYQG